MSAIIRSITPSRSRRSSKKSESLRLSVGSDGKQTLLHGILLIKIIEARGLRNLDGIRGLKTVEKYAPSFIQNDLSDPYVVVMAGHHRLAKTRIINDDLNPVWKETFYRPVAHYTENLEFVVKDSDIGFDELLGTHTLDVNELVKFKNDQPQRVGIHKIAELDLNNKKEGTLHYYVEYVPSWMLGKSLDVPGTYFKARKGNKVKLYVNADDIDDGSFKLVKYGGVRDNSKKWKPPRLWRDIYDSICDAKHFIYITGWSVDTSISLLRGKEREKAIKDGNYSPYIGELLKQKAEEGVVVNLLVWSDLSSSASVPYMDGVLGTHDKESQKYFEDTHVTFKLASMVGDDLNTIREKIGKAAMFTHHQKLVILDVAREDNTEKREPLAFVGGVDLTDGRWDNRSHPLFRTLGDDHKGDAYNACFNVDADMTGPRQPWQDIHSSVRGPGVLDVVRNFTERWYKQAADAVGDLINFNANDLGNPPENKSEDEWHTQLFRSIDSRTAAFDRATKASYVDVDIDDIKGVTFFGDNIKEHADAHSHKKKGSLSYFKDKATKIKDTFSGNLKTQHKGKERTRRFESLDADSFKFGRGLDCKKGRDTDASVHVGMVHHIRRAKHCLYIESQYFIGNSAMWDKCEKVQCSNLVAAEILLKICQKIENNERFAAYIVIPMFPEGIPESQAVQAILYWQYLTMQSMYKRIAQTLKAVGSDSKPTDFLNFYCLANRETVKGSTAPQEPDPRKPHEVMLNSTRRHQIYVHSKMIIIDDTVSLIGSANVNQRSLDGARDSEIVLGAYQPAHVATADSVPHGDVHGFRLHCFASITGSTEDIFKDPSSLLCVDRFNQIAEQNWNKYISDELCEMDSHVIHYPVLVEPDGTIIARPELEDGHFPDTKASVLGTYSNVLPDRLTT